MSAAKIGVDLVGVGSEIYLSLLFYGIFWEAKPVGRGAYAAGFCGMGLLNIFALAAYPNSPQFLATFVLISFLAALYFRAGMLDKAVLSLSLSALVILAELAVGIAMAWLLRSPVRHIQGRLAGYAFGLFASKLLAFALVHLARLTAPPKSWRAGKWFSFLMLLLPGMSLAVCFAIYGLAGSAGGEAAYPFSMLGLSMSILLVFVVMLMVKKHGEAMEYKQKYELSLVRMQERVKRASESYLTEQEHRKVEHGWRNNMAIIAGLLKDGRVQEASEHIGKMQAAIGPAERAASTGYAAIDSIVDWKSGEAAANGVSLSFNMVVRGELHVRQADMAMLLANALDNAAEAAGKCADGGDRAIRALVSSRGDYISIVVENGAVGDVDAGLRTTKADRAGHGFGVSQMREIAGRYDGRLDVRYDKAARRFTLMALLKNAPPDEAPPAKAGWAGRG